MILELVAGRLAAKQFGASLYCWTSVIGVTLAGLTLGNYIGGRLADSFPGRKIIGMLLAACSVSCVAAIILNNPLGQWSFLWPLGLRARILSHITIVFFIPTLLIGAISPVAVKMAIEHSRFKGGAVGKMYALGAAGSILGTFLAGFWLIGTIGTINTIWAVVAVMLLGAIIFLPKSPPAYAFSAFIAFLIIAGAIPADWARHIGSAMLLRQPRAPEILYETESQYSYVAVNQLSKQPDERVFVQDNLKSHSRIIIGDIRNLRFFYIQTYAAITHRIAKNKEKLCVLTIGGGGYVFPRYILDVWPASRVDVVELDPAVTEAATLAFGLSKDNPIHTINLDGRNYIDGLLENKRQGKATPAYDFVYMDAFNDLAVPFQLVTRQFNEKIFTILADDGVYIINLIDMLETAGFLAGFVNSLEPIFPYVYVISKPSLEQVPVNFIVIASKKPVNLENLNAEVSFSGTEFKIFDDNDFAALKKKSKVIYLDDDYAPMENLMAPVVRQGWALETARQYFEQAEKLDIIGKWQDAIKKYRQAIRICPLYSRRGYYAIGWILTDRGYHKEATLNFEQALNLNPDNPVYHSAVARSLAAQGKIDEAILRLNKGIQYLQNKGLDNDANQLKEMLLAIEAKKLK